MQPRTFNRTLSRPEPRLPVQAMDTFSIKAPPSTHTRPASCAEVECEHYRHGWTKTVLAGSDDAALIRHASQGLVDGHRRRYRTILLGGGMVRLEFPPEQPCFRALSHRVSLDRPEFYLLRGGDWRANTGLRRRYDRADQWVDDFATNQDRLSHTLLGTP